jgi:hypothetical protein
MTDELALAASLLALVVAIFSLLLSLGTAARAGRKGSGGPVFGTALATGDEAPMDSLAALDPDLETGRLTAGPVVVLFLSSGCRACPPLIDSINEVWTERDDPPGDRPLVVAVHDGDGDRLRGAARFDARWMGDTGGAARRAFKVDVLPSAYLLSDGRVVEAAVGARSEIAGWLTAETTRR